MATAKKACFGGLKSTDFTNDYKFSEENYLNYTQKRHKFAFGDYIFPKTRAKKSKQNTHYSLNS